MIDDPPFSLGHWAVTLGVIAVPVGVVTVLGWRATRGERRRRR